MSKGPENTFIGSVHKFLPDDLYRIKNNNQYHAGIADCWYSGMEADLWIEYKFVVVPKRPDTLIEFGLSKLQEAWLISRRAEGRNVALVVGCKAGGVWLPVTESVTTVTVQSNFVEAIKTRKELAKIIEEIVC